MCACLGGGYSLCMQMRRLANPVKECVNATKTSCLIQIKFKETLLINLLKTNEWFIS